MRPSTAVPPAQTTAVPTVSMATAPPSQANCHFDSGFCGWKQDKTDNFDWSRQKGPTSSLNTGPTSDHTGSECYSGDELLFLICIITCEVNFL